MSATTDKYTEERVLSMQQVILSGKANSFQALKYQAICEALRAEIKELLPADSKFTPWAKAHAVYLYTSVVAIEWGLNQHERELNKQAQANAHTAHLHFQNFWATRTEEKKP